MCLAVFIASNKPLPVVEWDKENPRFNVMPMSEHERKIAKQFKHSNIMYAGSNQGCGCGFFKEGVVGDELIESQSNYIALVEYIRRVRSAESKFEIYSCWEGDFEEKPEYKQKITLEQLVSSDFEFRERAHYEIT